MICPSSLRLAFDRVAVATHEQKTPLLILDDDAGGDALALLRWSDLFKLWGAVMARKYRYSPRGGDPMELLILAVAIQCADDLNDPIHNFGAAKFLSEWFPLVAGKLGIDV